MTWSKSLLVSFTCRNIFDRELAIKTNSRLIIHWILEGVKVVLSLKLFISKIFNFDYFTMNVRRNVRSSFTCLVFDIVNHKSVRSIIIFTQFLENNKHIPRTSNWKIETSLFYSWCLENFMNIHQWTILIIE